jgi:hypothetical protein
VPLYGLDVYQRMWSANPWVQDFLPNAGELQPGPQRTTGPDGSVRLRPLLERILMTAPGIWLGDWEMSRKIRKLSQENTGNIEAVFNADLCKGHSNKHAQRTQSALSERLTCLVLEPHR